MYLLDNPFCILSASPGISSKSISELAESRSLVRDSRECMQAKLELLNPRKRLYAELSWLPGVEEIRVKELLSVLESQPYKAIRIDGLPPLARSNLLISCLRRLIDGETGRESNLKKINVAKWFLEIGGEFEKLDTRTLHESINDARGKAGFPAVRDPAQVESAISKLRTFYNDVFRKALDRLSSSKVLYAVASVVDSSMKNERAPVHALIDDLVNIYELKMQKRLSNEENRILFLERKMRNVLEESLDDSQISNLVKRMTHSVKKWSKFAMPIQLHEKSRGLDHDASVRVAENIRSLYIDIFNEYGQLHFSMMLSNMVLEMFSHVVKIVVMVKEDMERLDEVFGRNLPLLNSDGVIEYDLDYVNDSGIKVTGKLRLSSKLITWRGKKCAFGDISGIYWGGGDLSIGFDVRSRHECVRFENSNVYHDVVQRLWKAVGMRLMFEHMMGLKNGRKYRFGSTLVTDHGMRLERCGNGEYVFCQWDEIEIRDETGPNCVIGKIGDETVFSELPYRSTPNVPVLEFALNVMMNDTGRKRMSSIIEG